MKILILSLSLLFLSQLALSQDKTLDEFFVIEVRADNAKKIRNLIDKGFDINAQDENGQTLLHFVAGRGDIEAAQFLIESGANINASDKNGKTPLHYAIDGAHGELIIYLSKNGADVRGIDISTKNNSVPIRFLSKAKTQKPNSKTKLKTSKTKKSEKSQSSCKNAFK